MACGLAKCFSRSSRCRLTDSKKVATASERRYAVGGDGGGGGGVSAAAPAPPTHEKALKDFELTGRVGEAVVRLPGSIDGQAFALEGCARCSVFLHDRCGQVTSDACYDSTIFGGPTAGRCL